MSKVLDETYIDQLASFVDLFAWERHGLARFSCPFCGDTHKRRGYLVLAHDTDEYYFHCHNCESHRGARMYRFLKAVNPQLAEQYLDEKIQESGFTGTKRKTIDEIEAEEKRERLAKSRTKPLFKPTPIITDKVFETMVRVSDLDDMHPCKRYVMDRKLPPVAHEVLFFSKNWKKTCQAFEPEESEVLEKLPEDERLVIPFYSTTGQPLVIQGRALNPDAFLRYITIKKKPGIEKTYGLERLNFQKPKLVVEGPIDSLFIPNCVATADADLLKFKDGDIYIPDNQYRNREVCEKIKKIIEANKKVVLFPEYIPEKDINDMVKSHGIKTVLGLIRDNIFQGIMAEMRFAELNKSPKKTFYR